MLLPKVALGRRLELGLGPGDVRVRVRVRVRVMVRVRVRAWVAEVVPDTDANPFT